MAVRYMNILTWLRGFEGQTSIFGGVFSLSKSLLVIERQKKLEKKLQF